MKIISNIVVLIICGFLLGCPDQEATTSNSTLCPSEFDLGDISLIDNSLAKFPYSEVDSKAIFTDSLGNEIDFEIKNLSTREQITSLPGKCSYNQSQNVTYIFKLIYRYVELVNDSLDLRFNISMTPELYPFFYSESEGNDILILNLNKPVDSSVDNEIFRLFVNRRNSNSGSGFLGIQPNYEETISLNDTNFEIVFWDQKVIMNNDFKIYFTMQNGIIGIQNQNTGLFLVFESVE
jgi:hypothetical protein